MIGRVFWFSVGAGVTIYAVVKVRAYLRRASPQAVGQRVADSATNVGASAQDFATRVRAAMAEREAELRDTLGLAD